MQLSTYKHTLSGFSSSHQDLICLQGGWVPYNLCCASAYLQTCIRSASDQTCLWAFSATGPGVLNGGFKGRIVTRSPRKIWWPGVGIVRWGCFQKFIPWRSKNTDQKKSSHLRIFLYSDILNFTYKNRRDRSSYYYIVNVLI